MDTHHLFKNAKCLKENVSTESFYPERGAPVSVRNVCKGCTVVKPCLEYSFKNNDKFGIWGGLSENQRRKIRSIKFKEQDFPKERRQTLSQIISLLGIQMSRLPEEELEQFSGEGFYK